MFPPVIIELKVSKEEFWVQNGRIDCRFFPVIFLSPDGRVEAIGYTDHPTTSAGIKLFEEDSAYALDLLESMLRYGMQSVMHEKFSFRPRHLIIYLHQDLRTQFKGFAAPLFTQVAIQAGAAKVTIRQ